MPPLKLITTELWALNPSHCSRYCKAFRDVLQEKRIGLSSADRTQSPGWVPKERERKGLLLCSLVVRSSLDGELVDGQSSWTELVDR